MRLLNHNSFQDCQENSSEIKVKATERVYVKFYPDNKENVKFHSETKWYVKFHWDQGRREVSLRPSDTWSFTETKSYVKFTLSPSGRWSFSETKWYVKLHCQAEVNGKVHFETEKYRVSTMKRPDLSYFHASILFVSVAAFK
jgi:hypothetical protein